MLQTVSTWVTVAAFAAAGLVNSLGRASTRADYIRWGYPAWWCYVTGALEFATAALIASPPARIAGLALGGLIVAAAILTVARRRELSHLPPLALFAALLVATALLRTA